jgi:hypothetical protein
MTYSDGEATEDVEGSHPLAPARRLTVFDIWHLMDRGSGTVAARVLLGGHAHTVPLGDALAGGHPKSCRCCKRRWRRI